jgi:hypothetical protein
MATPLARTAKPGRSLSRLADARASGTLAVYGDADGLLELRAGLVTGATLDGGGSSPWPAGEVGTLLDIADRLFVLCWGRVRECRFAPGPAGPQRPGLTVPRLLAEVDRRTAALSADGPPVDPLADRLRRRRGRPVPLTAAEEALLEVADGECSARELAVALGRSVFGTALDATRLVRVGQLEVVAVRPGLLAPLNRRRPGASRVRPRDPAPAPFDRSDPEVVDRLTSALDALRGGRRTGDENLS